MKRFIAAILVLLSLPAYAKGPTPTALLCLFEPVNLRFNLVAKGDQDMIQWEDKGFQAVMITVEDGYFIVKQYASTATFKAAIEIKSLVGYGIVSPFKGEPVKGDILCAMD